MYKKLFKVIFDKVIALICLIMLSPVLVVIYIVLAISLKGNPIFVQRRPGLNGRLFSLLKFRTMINKYGADNRLLPDMERITKVGSIIRKHSLDELPQLFNILKGDMSLIGPRPLLVQYLPLYNDTQAARHSVLPGITGWAQVNGRNGISWQQKFNYDIWYVNNIRFSTDMKILYLTMLNLAKQEDINQSKRETMEFFEGNMKS